MIIAFLIFLYEGIGCYLLRQFNCFAEDMNIICLVIVMINVVILSIILGRYAKTKKEYLILWVSFVARILIMLLDVYAPEMKINIYSGYDTAGYHNTALHILTNNDMSVSGNLYAYLLSLIYRIFGAQIIIAEYFNILLAMWAIVLVKDILYTLPINQKSRIIGFLIMALGPNYILLSPITLRESVIIFLITASLWNFTQWWNKQGLKHIGLAMALSIFGATFHSGAIAMAIAYGLIIIFFDQDHCVFKVNYKTIVMGIVVSLCFVVVSYTIGDMIFIKFQRINDILDIGQEVAYAEGGSAYLDNQISESIPDLILNTPIRILYFVGSPVPWQWRGVNDILAFLFSTLIYLCAIIYLIKALRLDGKNKNLIIMLLIMALSSAAIFAWGVSNAGTALRHREKFISIYVVMLAVGMNETKIIRNDKFLIQQYGDGTYPKKMCGEATR